jgi:hypothetical protein
MRASAALDAMADKCGCGVICLLEPLGRVAG